MFIKRAKNRKSAYLNQISSAVAAVVVLIWAGNYNAEAQSIGGVVDLSEFQTLCYDAERVGSIIQLYQSVLVTQANPQPASASGLAMVATALSDTLPKFCTLVVAIANAKNTEGVLNAVKVANRIMGLNLSTAIDAYEDSTNIYNFAQNLGSSNQNSKEKLLNINNHRRFLGFYNKWIQSAICNNADSCASRAVVERQKKDAITRLARTTPTINKLYSGCRVPIEEADAGKLRMPGGTEISPVEGLTYGSLINKAIDDMDEQESRAKKFLQVSRKMIAAVAHERHELISSINILDSLMKKSWLAVSIDNDDVPSNLDFDSDLEGVVTKQVEKTKGRALDPKSPTDSFREEVDMTKAFYKNQPRYVASPCRDENRATTQFGSWMINPENLLHNPYVKPKWVSDSLVNCPGSVTAVLSQPIGTTVNFVSEEEFKDISDARLKIEETKCERETASAIIDKLDKTKNLVDIDGVGLGNRETENCELSKSEKDALANQEQIETNAVTWSPVDQSAPLQDWIDVYNKRFNNYLFTEYNIQQRENAVSRNIRDASESFNSIFSERPTPQYSQDQRKFLSQWRNIISKCDHPKHISEKFGESAGRQIDPETGEEFIAYASLVQQCRQEEQDPKANENLFEYMVTGLVDAVHNYIEAKKTSKAMEIELGVFSPRADTKQIGCKEQLLPADIAKLNSFVDAEIYQALEALVEYSMMSYLEQQARTLKETKAEEQAKIEYQNRISQKIRIQRDGAILMQDGSAGSSEGLRNTVPSVATERALEKELGPVAKP